MSAYDEPPVDKTAAAAEAFYEAVFDKFTGKASEATLDEFAAWAWIQLGKAYADGYAQARAEWSGSE